MKSFLLVALGGALGCTLRYGIYLLFRKPFSPGFPWGLLIINISGCLLVGLFYAWLEDRKIFSESLRLLLILGLCGGFTSFSSFSYDLVRMVSNGQYWLSFSYITLSVVGGFLAVLAGIYLGKIQAS